MNKDVLLVICVVMTAGAVFFGVHAIEKQNQIAKGLDEERYSRMVAEESSQKSAAKVAVLENQVKSAESKMAKLKDILGQEKGVNSDLKNQYDKLVQNKASLEAKLKSVLEQKSAAEQQPAQQPVLAANTGSSAADAAVASAAAAGTAK
jgi:hypothetical protein